MGQRYVHTLAKKIIIVPNNWNGILCKSKKTKEYLHQLEANLLLFKNGKLQSVNAVNLRITYFKRYLATQFGTSKAVFISTSIPSVISAINFA